ncbi:MAG: hypothetical protein V1913_00960 [Fibrobacterota bacterium]
MGLKGQILELKNDGNYQFSLKIGVYDDTFTEQSALLFTGGNVEETGLPLDKDITSYECHLDFSDAEKPVSYPIGALKKCMDLYERYESPEGLSPENERLWKIGFITDTLIAEAFSTDFLEVIHGDDYEQEPEIPGEEWQATGTGINIRCPDCGAAVRVIHVMEKGKTGNYACEMCGRHFTL